MGNIKTLGDKAWRNYVTDGNSGSGYNQPDKSEIREFVAEIDTKVEELSVSGDTITKATWAGLSAITGTRNGQRGYVESDSGTHTDPVTSSTVHNNGIYTWVSASSAWQWLRFDDYDALQSKIATNAAILTAMASDAGITITQADCEAGYILKSDGSESSTTSGWIRTDFIAVLPSTKIVRSGSNVSTVSAAAAFAFYDENQTFLGQHTGGTSTDTITVGDLYADARYVRVSNASSVALSLTITHTIAMSAVSGMSPDFSLLASSFIVDFFETLTTSTGFINSSGTLGSNSNWVTTGFIPVITGQKFYVTASSTSLVMTVSLWDADKNYLGAHATGSLSDELVEITNASVKYIRVSAVAASSHSVVGVSIAGTSSDDDDGGDTDSTVKQSSLSADIVHIFRYGQSTSIGLGGNPPLTITAGAYGTLMFAGGIRLFNNPDLTSFADAIETVDPGGSSAYGETGCRMEGDYAAEKLGASSHGFEFLVSAGGRSGASIAQLSKGATYYTNAKTLLTNGLSNSAALGKLYAVGFMTYIQGETDQSSGNDRGTYRDALIQLRSDWSADMKTTTGQTWEPFMLTYQTCQHLYYYANNTEENYVNAPSTPEIALAQYEAATMDSNVKNVIPSYLWDYADEGVHGDEESYRMTGYYFGRAGAAVMAARLAGEKDPPVAVRPLDVLRQGRIIEIRFEAPVLPLQFRTDFVAEISNYGFDIWDASDADNLVLSDIISAVTIRGTDRVRITCSADLPTTAKLTCAWGRPGVQTTSGRLAGPRSNLCDSAGDTDAYTASDGTRRLDNYALVFELDL